MTYQEGDPNHIGVHNDLVTSVDELASGMGVDVDLPPTRQLGDTGHVGDHNTIQAALDKIAAEGSAGASWAQVLSAPDAVTQSYYDDKGGQWAYYEWNAPGSFSVELSGGLVWVLCVGGGDAGAAEGVTGQGQPGLVNEGLWEFGPGTHPVTVGHKGANNAATNPSQLGAPSSVGDYGTQGYSSWGQSDTGRGSKFHVDPTGYVSSITGDPLEYATGANGLARPGRSSYTANTQRDGCVIIATRIDVPTLPPAPPQLQVAPVVAKPVSITGPEVQEWLVRDKQNNRKVVYFLPGNTGTARSLALTDDGAEALAARRELLDAIATTEVPEDYDGDPVTLLPKKLRAELRGFVEVRAGAQPEAVYSVTLGAGVLPGVMVGSGGPGGYTNAGVFTTVGGGGAGGVIGQGAHVPVILPVQGTATYTIKVGSTSTFSSENDIYLYGQNTTIAVQGQTPFIAAIGGGGGMSYRGSQYIQPHQGASGGGGVIGSASGTVNAYWAAAKGIPGQGNDGGMAVYGWAGGGGGYSAPGEGTTAPYQSTAAAGGAGFDLAAALNLDANDGITGSFLDQVSVNGRIAGGGSAGAGVGVDGGGVDGGAAKDFTGGGGGSGGGYGGSGGAGAVYIITDPT